MIDSTPVSLSEAEEATLPDPSQSIGTVVSIVAPGMKAVTAGDGLPNMSEQYTQCLRRAVDICERFPHESVASLTSFAEQTSSTFGG